MKFIFTDAKEFGTFVALCKCATNYGEMYEGSGVFSVTVNPSLFDINEIKVRKLAVVCNGKEVI